MIWVKLREILTYYGLDLPVNCKIFFSEVEPTKLPHQPPLLNFQQQTKVKEMSIKLTHREKENALRLISSAGTKKQLATFMLT